MDINKNIFGEHLPLFILQNDNGPSKGPYKLRASVDALSLLGFNQCGMQIRASIQYSVIKSYSVLVY